MILGVVLYIVSHDIYYLLSTGVFALICIVLELKRINVSCSIHNVIESNKIFSERLKDLRKITLNLEKELVKENTCELYHYTEECDELKVNKSCDGCPNQIKKKG